VAGFQTVPQRNLTCAVRIRERRRQLGMTQADVVRRVSAHGSRLSNQGLSAIENGRRLAVGRLPDLAAALECTVTYLLGLTAEPRRWEPDKAAPEAAKVPAATPARAAAAARAGTPARAGATAAAGTPARAGATAAAGTPAPGADPVTPPRRSWILGPDVPDIRGEAAPYSWRPV
jgi:transcriptional regulator with XRE-family HTH domain